MHDLLIIIVRKSSANSKKQVSDVKFGVALLRCEDKGASAGVLKALKIMGVRVGAIYGEGISALTALLYSLGISPEEIEDKVSVFSRERTLFDLLFWKKAKKKKEIGLLFERHRVRLIGDSVIPVYLAVSDKEGRITVITSEKETFCGKHVKKCEMSSVSAADWIIENAKTPFADKVNFKTLLEFQGVNAVISVSGEEKKSGPTEYGYNISFPKNTDCALACKRLCSENEEMLKTIFLR